jgi:hypothetical protein
MKQHQLIGKKLAGIAPNKNQHKEHKVLVFA